MTEGERLAVLEYKDTVREAQLTEISQKLDDLLALRQKGVGAFWLASSLLGTGIIGAIFLIIQYFRGY